MPAVLLSLSLLLREIPRLLMPMQIKTLASSLFLLLPFACAAAQSVSTCGEPGQWLSPTSAEARSVTAAALMDRMAMNQVVLLGETHDSAEDHRWQLHSLSQLHARQPRVALGLEMFPRRIQPVLDRWVAGELSEQDFLRQSEWDKVWGFDARDYLPLFHYARMNRIPMLALNVERSLPEAVDSNGWDGVPEARREGVSRPAQPSTEYLNQLRMVFEHHPQKRGNEAAFSRFVEAQTLWDRAMAQAIADHLKQRPDGLVVAILGAGHVRHGHGVAHQLKDLGVNRVGALLTWDHQTACTNTVGLADALYVTRPPALNPPRLGISMEDGQSGVRIVEIMTNSVADRAGLKAGDVLVEIAGRPAKFMQDVRGAVQRQAPGTWLPMRVRRGGEELEIVARFPSES